MSKTLLESAAGILEKSKSAPSMPPEKISGAKEEDIGGPTPQNSKPSDESNKVTPAKSIGKAEAPKTKPSDASSDTQLRKEENEKEEDEKEMKEELDLQEDIDSIFKEENISEEFRTKVKTIFEARVNDRVSQIQESLEEEYASKLETIVSEIDEELTGKVNEYLDYVVEEWMQENQVAVEKGLRSELVEEFIVGMKNLFAEHYIDVPEEKVDIVEELAIKVEELESKLNEEIQRGIDYKKQLVEAKKAEIIVSECENLTDTQYEKIKSLVESIEFSTEEEYAESVRTIRDNYFPTNVKVNTESSLNEQVESESDAVITDPVMKAYAQAISKTIVK